MTYEKMAALMHNMDRVDMANLAMVALDQAGLKGPRQCAIAIIASKGLGLSLGETAADALWFSEPEL